MDEQEQQVTIQENQYVPDLKQKPKHKFKKFIIVTGLLILVVFLFISFPFWLTLLTKDIAMPKDFEPILQIITIPENENAFYDLIKLTKDVVYEPSRADVEDHLNGIRWDSDFVNDVLSKNIQTFVYLNQAAQKSKFQDPVFSDPTQYNLNTELSKTSSWWPAARIKALGVLSLAKEGEPELALNEALKLIEIGQKIQESQPSLIGFLVAIKIKEEGLKVLHKIIANNKLAPEVIENTILQLEKFKKNEEGLKRAFKAEYQLVSNELDRMGFSIEESVTIALSGELPEEEIANARLYNDFFYFRPNQTKVLFADSWKVTIDAVNNPCALIETKESPQLIPSSPWKALVTENLIGRYTFHLMSPATPFTAPIKRKCYDDLLISVTQLLLATKAYIDNNNKVPSSLNDLVPDYIQNIPSDPFDGKQMKYSPSKKLIYSVGLDLIDGGGTEGESGLDDSDPSFKIK